MDQSVSKNLTARLFINLSNRKVVPVRALEALMQGSAIAKLSFSRKSTDLLFSLGVNRGVLVFVQIISIICLLHKLVTSSENVKGSTWVILILIHVITHNVRSNVLD